VAVESVSVFFSACLSVCLSVCVTAKIIQLGKGWEIFDDFYIRLVLFWPRLACNLRYLQRVTTTTLWNRGLVRSSDSDPTSSPSNQTSYKSSLYHAFESAMVQTVSVENVIPDVLHILDLIIIVQ